MAFPISEPPVQQAAVFRDGTSIVIYKDLDKSCASLARFSRQDAETFRELWHTYCEEMRPLLVSLLYNAPMPREQLVDRLSDQRRRSCFRTPNTISSASYVSTLSTSVFELYSRPICT